MSIIFNNSFLTSRGPLFSLILDSSTPALAAAGRIVKERSEQANDTLRSLSLCSRASRPALAEVITDAHAINPTVDHDGSDIPAGSNLHFLTDSLVDLEGFSDDSALISSTPMRKRIRPGLSDSSPEESMSFSCLLPSSEPGSSTGRPLNPMAAVFLPSSICLPPGDPPSPIERVGAEVPQKLSRKARKRLRAKLRRLQLPPAPLVGVQAGPTVFGSYHPSYSLLGGCIRPSRAPLQPSTRPLNPRAAEFIPSSLRGLVSCGARPTPGEQVQVHEPPAELTRRVNKWLAKSQMTLKVSPDPQEGYANIATRDPIVQPRFLPVEHLRYHNHSTRGEMQFHAPLPAPNWLPSLPRTIPTQSPFRDAPTTGPPTRNLAPRRSYIRTPLVPPTTYGYPHYIPTTDPSQFNVYRPGSPSNYVF